MQRELRSFRALVRPFGTFTLFESFLYCFFVYPYRNLHSFLIPTIGGWTLSDAFVGMAASATSRQRFAEQCVELIQDYGFDGKMTVNVVHCTYMY